MPRAHGDAASIPSSATSTALRLNLRDAADAVDQSSISPTPAIKAKPAKAMIAVQAASNSTSSGSHTTVLRWIEAKAVAPLEHSCWAPIGRWPVDAFASSIVARPDQDMARYSATPLAVDQLGV